MDDFLEEFYEEWMDTVIEQIPLTNRAPPHYNQLFYQDQQEEYEQQYEHEHQEHQEHRQQYYYPYYQEHQEHQEHQEQLHQIGSEQQLPPPITLPNLQENDSSQHLYPNYIHNQMYQRTVRFGETNNMHLGIYDSLVSNLYRLRRTLQIQNELNRQSNSIFDELLSLVTDGISENIPNETEFEDVKVTLLPEQFEKLKTHVISEDTLENYKEHRCNICMDNYNVSDTVTELDCSHFFHSSCIEYWLCNEHVTCPICRKDTREGVSLQENTIPH